MPSPSRTFRVLAVEALADATRRRIVPVIAVAALLSLMLVESCTSCTPTIIQNGEKVDLPQVAGFGSLVLMVVLGLWTMVLGGVLASDHLVEPLEDGSATLTLARPVSRTSFALARLAGSLALACATGALLLGVTAFLLQARHEFSVVPVLWAGLACALNTASVAGLAMTASLFLPRIATALLVFAGVWAIAWLEGLAQFGVELPRLAALIEGLAPPLASAMVVALGAWIEPTATRGEPLLLALRSLLWAFASTALLALAFRRREIGG